MRFSSPVNFRKALTPTNTVFPSHQKARFVFSMTKLLPDWKQKSSKALSVNVVVKAYPVPFHNKFY